MCHRTVISFPFHEVELSSAQLASQEKADFGVDTIDPYDMNAYFIPEKVIYVRVQEPPPSKTFNIDINNKNVKEISRHQFFVIFILILPL